MPQNSVSSSGSGRGESAVLMAHVVRVMDCPMWTVRATSMLHAQCPRALISVETCVGSLSGFVVVVSEPTEPPHLFLRIAMIAAVGLLVLMGGSALVLGAQDDRSTPYPSVADAAREVLQRWWAPSPHHSPACSAARPPL